MEFINIIQNIGNSLKVVTLSDVAMVGAIVVGGDTASYLIDYANVEEKIGKVLADALSVRDYLANDANVVEDIKKLAEIGMLPENIVMIFLEIIVAWREELANSNSKLTAIEKHATFDSQKNLSNLKAKMIEANRKATGVKSVLDKYIKAKSPEKPKNQALPWNDLVQNGLNHVDKTSVEYVDAIEVVKGALYIAIDKVYMDALKLKVGDNNYVNMHQELYGKIEQFIDEKINLILAQKDTAAMQNAYNSVLLATVKEAEQIEYKVAQEAASAAEHAYNEKFKEVWDSMDHTYNSSINNKEEKYRKACETLKKVRIFLEEKSQPNSAWPSLLELFNIFAIEQALAAWCARKIIWCALQARDLRLYFVGLPKDKAKELTPEVGIKIASKEPQSDALGVGAALSTGATIGAPKTTMTPGFNNTKGKNGILTSLPEQQLLSDAQGLHSKNFI